MSYAGKIYRALGRKAKDYLLRRELVKSQLFLPKWYLTANPDVAGARMDPYTHYLQFGLREGRNPSPNFNTSDYLTANPDVQKAGLNPLLHYWQHGLAEGRLLKVGPFRSQTYRRLIAADNQPTFVS